jgi:hypothetical protein
MRAFFFVNESRRDRADQRERDERERERAHQREKEIEPAVDKFINIL